MKKIRIKKIKNIIVSALILAFAASSFVIYRTLRGPQFSRFESPPAGRVYTVVRGDMSVGINGSNKIAGGLPRKVTIKVSQQEIENIHLGQIAGIWVEELNKNFDGEVVSTEASGNSYNVTISIKNGDAIKEGMLGDVQIILKTKKDVLKIPSLAVHVNDEGQKYVWIAPQKETGKSPIRRFVEVGLMDERNAEILSGLSEGEMIVVPSRT